MTILSLSNVDALERMTYMSTSFCLAYFHVHLSVCNEVNNCITIARKSFRVNYRFSKKKRSSIKKKINGWSMHDKDINQ